MRRWLFSTFIAVLVVLIQASPAQAAGHRLGADKAEVRSLDGVPLQIVEKGRPVLLVAVVTNIGTANSSDLAAVDFSVEGPTTYAYSSVVARTFTLDVNETVDVTVQWTPEQTGRHYLNVTLRERPTEIFHYNFTVGTAEVVKGSLWERAVGYSWFYGAFLGLAVLFVAAVRVRKPPA